MAKILTIIYLGCVVASLLVLLLAGHGDSLAGIFLVVVAVPWPLVLGWLNALLKIDSMTFNTLFLLAGALVNALILYRLLSFLQRRILMLRHPK